jgi:ACS family glucarate transporter-like MFS transporter
MHPERFHASSRSLDGATPNAAGIVTPVVIGYILESTGSFNLALVFVGLNALVTVLSYALVVGKIQRIEFQNIPA